MFFYNLGDRKMESSETEKLVVCEVFSSCRCTICGAYFADGDDICGNGHQIGCKYSGPASNVPEN